MFIRIENSKQFSVFLNFSILRKKLFFKTVAKQILINFYILGDM